MITVSGNKSNNRTYYVVTSGRMTGIYKNHEKAKAQVIGYPNGKMKKIKGIRQAKEYYSKHRVNDLPVYYVVTVGRKPGLYKDYNKALKQVVKFPCGHMKKVVGYQKAKKYFDKRNFMTCKKNLPTIYTDGSYDQSKGLSGYGYVVTINNEIVFRDSGVILDSDIINLQSLGSEIFALLRAMEWSISNNYKEVKIVYDSTAILSLINNGEETRTKRSKGKSKFIKIYRQYSEHLKIHFQHRNSDELLRHYHRQAHNLSRLSVGLLS